MGTFNNIEATVIRSGLKFAFFQVEGEGRNVYISSTVIASSGIAQNCSALRVGDRYSIDYVERADLKLSVTVIRPNDAIESGTTAIERISRQKSRPIRRARKGPANNQSSPFKVEQTGHGDVVSWDPRGYGFIAVKIIDGKSVEPNADIYIHISVLRAADVDASDIIGTGFDFVVGENHKGRIRVAKVTMIYLADEPPRDLIQKT